MFFPSKKAPLTNQIHLKNEWNAYVIHEMRITQ